MFFLSFKIFHSFQLIFFAFFSFIFSFFFSFIVSLLPFFLLFTYHHNRIYHYSSRPGYVTKVFNLFPSLCQFMFFLFFFNLFSLCFLSSHIFFLSFLFLFLFFFFFSLLFTCVTITEFIITLLCDQSHVFYI